MDGHAIYMHGHAKNDDFPIDFAIFTKALPTDGPTDQQTDIPSYRDAIAASKKLISFGRYSWYNIKRCLYEIIVHTLAY